MRENDFTQKKRPLKKSIVHDQCLEDYEGMNNNWRILQNRVPPLLKSIDAKKRNFEILALRCLVGINVPASDFGFNNSSIVNCCN